MRTFCYDVRGSLHNWNFVGRCNHITRIALLLGSRWRLERSDCYLTRDCKDDSFSILVTRTPSASALLKKVLLAGPRCSLAVNYDTEIPSVAQPQHGDFTI